MRPTSVDLSRGLAAGFAATVPMTVAMECMHRALPADERQPLPPRQITESAIRRTGAEEVFDDEEDRAGAAYAAHFAFGSSMGALYAVAEPHLPGPPLARGLAFAGLVYASNYLGLMPALGLTPHAPRDSAPRIGLMVAAHAVYGASLALLFGLGSRHVRRH